MTPRLLGSTAEAAGNIANNVEKCCTVHSDSANSPDQVLSSTGQIIRKICKTGCQPDNAVVG